MEHNPLTRQLEVPPQMRRTNARLLRGTGFREEPAFALAREEIVLALGLRVLHVLDGLVVSGLNNALGQHLQLLPAHALAPWPPGWCECGRGPRGADLALCRFDVLLTPSFLRFALGRKRLFALFLHL